MQEQTRYRISGSLFLLALAVIFIPMIFDGGESPDESESLVRPAVEPTPEVALYEEIVPLSDVVERVDELRGEVDDEGFTTSTGERFGEPVLVPITDETKIWAVQAGAFSDLDNAHDLRAALRNKGLEAFLSTIKTSDGQLHRVAVGPLLARADADRIRAKIDGEFDLAPQIVEMRP